MVAGMVGLLVVAPLRMALRFLASFWTLNNLPGIRLTQVSLGLFLGCAVEIRSTTRLCSGLDAARFG